MTLCLSEKKATRSGKQRENDCKITFAGRCGSMASPYNAASDRNTKKDGGFLLSQNEFVDEWREIQIQSHRRKEKEIQCHNQSKQN